MGLNLGWVYLFMGIVIGSAVIPLWNMMTWDKASGKGAIIAAWGGFILALVAWFVGAAVESGSVTVGTLGSNPVMLSGNLVAILSSGFIHYVYSKFIDPQEYDFATLDANIHLVEQDTAGLTEDVINKDEIRRSKRWIVRRGYLLTFVLIIVWPILSIPAQVFTESYFSFWVLVSIAWGFGAAIVISFLPLFESQDEIGNVCSGMLNYLMCKKVEEVEYAEEEVVKEVDGPEPEPKPDPEPKPEPEPAKEGDIDMNIIYDGEVKNTESDEYVEITNTSKSDKILSGYLLVDINFPDTPNESVGETFKFPTSTVLESGKSVRVYTNEIHEESGGYSFGSGRAVWNNKSGKGLLKDTAENVIAQFVYSKSNN